jgi:hypothetical protein
MDEELVAEFGEQVAEAEKKRLVSDPQGMSGGRGLGLQGLRNDPAKNRWDMYMNYCIPMTMRTALDPGTKQHYTVLMHSYSHTLHSTQLLSSTTLYSCTHTRIHCAH